MCCGGAVHDRFLLVVCFFRSFFSFPHCYSTAILPSPSLSWPFLYSLNFASSLATSSCFLACAISFCIFFSLSHLSDDALSLFRSDVAVVMFSFCTSFRQGVASRMARRLGGKRPLLAARRQNGIRVNFICGCFPCINQGGINRLTTFWLMDVFYLPLDYVILKASRLSLRRAGDLFVRIRAKHCECRSL